MKLHVQTLDRKIWRRDKIATYIQQCANNEVDAVIDFCPEGSCAAGIGLYRLLDELCEKFHYDKKRITICTANMLEHHLEYKIKRVSSYWYEINILQDWAKDKTILTGTHPTQHFANFTNRSNWFRLWIATILNKFYPGKTLQTYHYDPERENLNANGYIGLDDLVKYRCNLVSDAVQFIETCPRTIDIDYLKSIDYSKVKGFQHTDENGNRTYYPISHPANLNLLQYYNNIFIDIVVEPNITGNCFLVTEKLWRCILARRPFIVVSNVGYLANLQRLGFKTFNNFWDESYDNSGVQHRIKDVQSLLAVISEWDIDRLHTTLEEMQDTLDHNYNLFMTLTFEKIDQVFN